MTSLYELALAREQQLREDQKIEEENKKEYLAKGEQEGICTTLHQLILSKYEVDASTWLSTLSIKQLEEMPTLLLQIDTFEELQHSIQSMGNK